MTGSSARSWAGSGANLLQKLLHPQRPNRHAMRVRRVGLPAAMAVRNAVNVASAARRVGSAVNVAGAASVLNEVAVANVVRVVSAKAASAAVKTGNVVAASAVRAKIVRRKRVNNSAHR
jgi:hypothetical protein